MLHHFVTSDHITYHAVCIFPYFPPVQTAISYYL